MTDKPKPYLVAPNEEGELRKWEIRTWNIVDRDDEFYLDGLSVLKGPKRDISGPRLGYILRDLGPAEEKPKPEFDMDELCGPKAYERESLRTERDDLRAENARIKALLEKTSTEEKAARMGWHNSAQDNARLKRELSASKVVSKSNSERLGEAFAKIERLESELADARALSDKLNFALTQSGAREARKALPGGVIQLPVFKSVYDPLVGSISGPLGTFELKERSKDVPPGEWMLDSADGCLMAHYSTHRYNAGSLYFVLRRLDAEEENQPGKPKPTYRKVRRGELKLDDPYCYEEVEAKSGIFLWRHRTCPNPDQEVFIPVVDHIRDATKKVEPPTCKTCGGSGKVKVPIPRVMPHIVSMHDGCPSFHYHFKPCPDCKPKKKPEPAHTFEAAVKRGMERYPIEWNSTEVGWRRGRWIASGCFPQPPVESPAEGHC